MGTRPRSRLHHGHQRLVDQPGQHADADVGDRFSRGGVETADERAEAAEPPLLVKIEQPVAPLDRRPHRAVMSRCRSPPSSSRRSSRLAEISVGDIALTRAAASSIAKGNRSSFQHRAAMASSSSSAGTKPGFRCTARSTNNRRASSAASGSTGTTNSPGTPRTSRLVASSRTFGQAPSNAEASSAHPSITCSQLSRTSGACRSVGPAPKDQSRR